MSEPKTAPQPSAPDPTALCRQALSGLPELLRFLYLALLPLAGCAAVKHGGGDIGRGWGLGIAIGLFIYHYLLWALFETERIDQAGTKRWISIERWTWLGSPLLVLLAVRGAWTEWLVEQTLIETGMFAASVSLLALRKCLDEGKQAPWLLAFLVFVLPAAAFLVKFVWFWIARRGGVFAWIDLFLPVAMLFSLGGFYRRLHPFVLGRDQLMEPLSTAGRTIFMVLWFVALLVAAIMVGA